MFPKVRDLLPHQGPALLLEEVLAYEGQRTVCRAVIDDGHPYLADGSGTVGEVLALELMAQTVGVHASLARKVDEVKRGYIVSVPVLDLSGRDFRSGDRLEVEAREVWHEGPLGRFEATVRDEHGVRATGTLNVFEPSDEPATTDRETTDD